jgi:hypothetical protein
MTKLSPILLGLSLAVAGSALTAAQETPTATSSMPKVLTIMREFIKPGKSGAAHDKSESAFVQAMARAKWPTHYIALNSLSGKSRALYITPYASYEAWGKDNDAVEKNKTLMAELERASVADGELLDSMETGIFTYNESMSYNADGDLSHARYMELTLYHIRHGHGEEFREAVKKIIDAHKQGGSTAHWATFHLDYGGEGGTYIMFTAYKSLADLDSNGGNDMRAHDSIGEENWKKVMKTYGEAVDSTNRELFSINPRQSYPPEEWVKAASDFWKPKPAAKSAMEEKKAKP